MRQPTPIHPGETRVGARVGHKSFYFLSFVVGPVLNGFVCVIRRAIFLWFSVFV